MRHSLAHSVRQNLFDRAAVFTLQERWGSVRRTRQRNVPIHPECRMPTAGSSRRYHGQLIQRRSERRPDIRHASDPRPLARTISDRDSSNPTMRLASDCRAVPTLKHFLDGLNANRVHGPARNFCTRIKGRAPTARRCIAWVRLPLSSEKLPYLLTGVSPTPQISSQILSGFHLIFMIKRTEL